jgi:hypothetical protein
MNMVGLVSRKPGSQMCINSGRYDGSIVWMRGCSQCEGRAIVGENVNGGRLLGYAKVYCHGYSE